MPTALSKVSYCAASSPSSHPNQIAKSSGNTILRFTQNAISSRVSSTPSNTSEVSQNATKKPRVTFSLAFISYAHSPSSNVGTENLAIKGKIFQIKCVDCIICNYIQFLEVGCEFLIFHHCISCFNGFRLAMKFLRSNSRTNA